MIVKKTISQHASKKVGLLIAAVGLALIVGHWCLDTVLPNQLLLEVPRVTEIGFFETKYLYFLMHLFPIIPIVALSFDKKVAYYKQWKFVFPAVFVVAIPFWIWDVFKTSEQVWGFNPRYYTLLIGNLPIEEWLFFITFPWASLFIYECMNCYFNKSQIIIFFDKIDTLWSGFLIVFFLLIGALWWGHLYTVTTFWTAGFLLLLQFLYGKKSVRLKFYRCLPIMFVPFILVNAVLSGYFTAQPLVIYNPAEYLGYRFLSIPLDDFVYNFSLELGVVVAYEWFKS